MAEEKKVELGFFRLDKADDSVNARIMHKSIDTIENYGIHTITTEGKRKKVKCIDDKCPLCEKGIEKTNRIFIHIYDYGKKQHLVWDRTDKILDTLKKVQDDWGDLCSVPVRITRETNEFPKYRVDVLPPKNFEEIDMDTVDTKVAYRCGIYRSADELKQYVETGVLPAHKKNDSKEYTPKSTAETRISGTPSTIDETHQFIEADDLPF